MLDRPHAGIHKSLITAFVVLLTPGCAQRAQTDTSTTGFNAMAKPPIARRVAHKMIKHGHQRVDPYYWLRDDKRQAEPVLAYLRAEETHTKTVLEPTTDLQKQLFEEIKGRIKKDDSTVPYERDGFWYYVRYEEHKEHPIYCRKKGSLDATEQVLIDVNVEAAKHKYYVVGNLKVSPDGTLLAFAEDTLSRRIYTIRFKDLTTGKILPDEIPTTSASMAWADDNKTLFYVVRDPKTLRAYRASRHTLGSDPKDDTLVFEEKDDTFHIGIGPTKSRKYLVIGSESTLVTEQRFLAANNPTGSFEVFFPREAKHEYSIDHGHDDRFFIRTNWNAENFRLMTTTLATRQDKSSWQELIAHSPTVLFEDFELFRDYLVLNERRNGLLGLRVIPWADPSAEHSIDFGEPLFMASPNVNVKLDTTTLRYSYSSMVTPQSVYDYDLKTRKKTLRKQQEVLGGFNQENYVSKRLWATAGDGTKIPISLVHRKDLDRSKPQPLYQYGYGSYGHSMDPYFSHTRLSLLDRGFIFAMVHIRGGEEMGRAWYENGKLLKKRNTFTDFIDCSRYLIEKGYTSAEQLIASGGSAGGLLVGAVANMAPELYRAVIAHVPFVDVVTTMLDESIPLTTFEYDEWGNPNDKPYYEYMLSYSPYDQVRAQAYPHMFVFTGLHDSQVQYWEPAKWVAKLRHHKTDTNLLLLHTNMETGHGGASGRFKRYREMAMEYAFLVQLLNRK